MATTKRLVKGSALTAAEHDANVTAIDDNTSKLAGIETGAEVNTINSTTTGEPTGSAVVPNIVTISQANYDAAVTAGTIVSTTFYVTT